MSGILVMKMAMFCMYPADLHAEDDVRVPDRQDSRQKESEEGTGGSTCTKHRELPEDVIFLAILAEPAQ